MTSLPGSPGLQRLFERLRGETVPGRSITNPTSRFTKVLRSRSGFFDLTAADPRWHGHRCQEILRAREEFCRLFFDPEVPAESAEGLRKYFYGFAHAARMLHYRRQRRG